MLINVITTVIIVAAIFYLVTRSLVGDISTTMAAPTAGVNNNTCATLEKQFKIMTKNRTYIGFKDAENEEWSGPFTFIQATDTQLGLQERLVEKIKDYGWSKEVAWTREMVAEVNSMEPKPKFVVITGDLVDAFPSPDMARMRMMQERDLKCELIKLETMLVCLSGNHDVGDSPTPLTVAKYVRSFGDDYFSFMVGGVYFLALNSQFFKNCTLSKSLCQEQEAWLDSEVYKIKEMRPKHAIVFMHIPLFTKHPSEETEYFNLDQETRDKLTTKFRDAGIKHIFSGHYHRNAGGFDGDLEVVVSSAVGAQLGNDKNGYRVVNVYEDRIEHFYKTLDSTIA